MQLGSYCTVGHSACLCQGQDLYSTPGHQSKQKDSAKGLSTREAGRGHATPHMPVETTKCWWLLKIEPNALAGSKGSCAVCVDLQAVGALEFFGELYSLAKGWGWAGFREREGSIFSNHQHFAVSTGICGVPCPIPASRVDKPLIALRSQQTRRASKDEIKPHLNTTTCQKILDRAITNNSLSLPPSLPPPLTWMLLSDWCVTISLQFARRESMSSYFCWITLSRWLRRVGEEGGGEGEGGLLSGQLHCVIWPPLYIAASWLVTSFTV